MAHPQDRGTFHHEDNIEEVDYLSDYINDGEASDANEESDWDASTMSIVPLTPHKIEFAAEAAANGAITGYTPLKKAGGTTPFGRHNDALKAIVPMELPTRGFLSSFQSPPEQKPRKSMFEEGFSIDNRTKTPCFPVPVQRTDSDDSEDSGNRASLSYGPSKYLNDSSPQKAFPRYSDSRFGLKPTAPPASPANQSVASFQTNNSQMSTDSRRYSVMSGRSSTSVSLLFGEVINLDGSRMLAANSRSANSGYRDRDPVGDRRLQHLKDDVEMQGLGTLEGIEIGGGGARAFRGVPIPLHEPGDRRPPMISFGIPPDFFSSKLNDAKQISHTACNQVKKLTSKIKGKSQRVMHHYRPPLSPHARALEDLEYLQQAHKEKVGQLTENALMEDHFDFVLLLKPQEVYRFYAELLDFRVEHLGEEATDVMDPIIETGSTHSTDTRESEEVEGQPDQDYSTPLTGIRRRGKTPFFKNKMTPSSVPVQLPRPSFATPFFSPGNPHLEGTDPRRVKNRLSMFEKAIGVHSPLPRPVDESMEGYRSPMRTEPRASVASVRRRWGNRAMHTQAATANILSPPVRSLTRGNASVKKLRAKSNSSGKTKEEEAQKDEEQENAHPNRILSEEDIPNPVIPRGIAARTNGMLQFLSALKRGIVVRRHRANKDAIYCKIHSNDGGDTIQYQLIDPEEAMVAFKEQRVRFNRKLSHGSTPASVRAVSREWSCLDDPGDGSPTHKFNVPDHVASQRYREKISREHGLKKRVFELATKAANSGMIRTADVSAVHPATHLDPRHPGVRKGEFGTSSLRRSKSNHLTSHTFSIVTLAGQRFGAGKAKTEGNENRWYSGEGNELQFKTLDFEAATEGEYWLIFRGFLLLYRDADVGRFAAERRAGIGGGSRTRERDDGEEGTEEKDELENLLHRDEFNEPVTVGCLEKLIVKARKLDTTYMKGTVSPTAVPPPSDYFLGFKSPGTQVSI
jgi:hypothetical protein